MIKPSKYQKWETEKNYLCHAIERAEAAGNYEAAYNLARELSEHQEREPLPSS